MTEYRKSRREMIGKENELGGVKCHRVASKISSEENLCLR